MATCVLRDFPFNGWILGRSKRNCGGFCAGFRIDFVKQLPKKLLGSSVTSRGEASNARFSAGTTRARGRMQGNHLSDPL